ncbi:ReoY family proteolytic degradation factor [Alkalihalobacterium alkalinitrilicum]|uniref:ReoY family proteolytic degradation factor n=1 Tax=Alkalihalobacterium alkalinitrilicum TaxID=427920 RepID=UPI00099526B3|nr:ReoY family proteolytic degradation factor [Alkalihalobacterium alkalinitrilicum]
MSSTISVYEKKEFLRWFLNAYQLKRRECAWLLNYLISDENLMEKVHFVERAEFCPKALIISTTDVDHVPFCFHKHKHVTMDAEKAFHDIRLNNTEEVYIQLNFSNAKTNPHYVAVLEDNPYIPENQMATADALLAEIFLDKALASFREKQWYEEMNEALDNKDEETFNQLINKKK